VQKILEKLDFFSGLDEKLLSKVAVSALLRTYPKGEVIVRQGDVGLGLYAIVRGRVKVEREYKGSQEFLAELGPEQFFAEMSIIDDKPRSATITTLEDNECILLTRDSFLKLVKSNPDLALRIAKVLAERLRIANDKIAAAQAGDVAAVARPVNGAPPSASQSASGAVEVAISPGAPDASMKSRIQDSMLDTFKRFYSMKALVRFSVAILGCPVIGVAPNVLGEIRVGEAKALLLPAEEDVCLDIVATDNGSFTLGVLTPDAQEPVGFGPLPIRICDHYQLRLNHGAVALWNRNSVAGHPSPWETEIPQGRNPLASPETTSAAS
jgi:CRP-like cAMP-binding protein